jgi:hypothetical protein
VLSKKSPGDDNVIPLKFGGSALPWALKTGRGLIIDRKASQQEDEPQINAG